MKRYFSATKWDRNTICVLFYSLSFHKPEHVQNVHLLPQYTPNNDIEQSDILSGLLLMEYHWWYIQNVMNFGFLDTNLMRTLPQWLLWGSCKNLHDCISILFISGTSLSSALTFDHMLHRSINFKLVSNSFHCYSCWWWCTKFNPPTSLNFQQHFPLSNDTSVTTYNHRMIISPPCLFKYMKNNECVATFPMSSGSHTIKIVFLSHFVAEK